jgi:hypothetical protein
VRASRITIRDLAVGFVFLCALFASLPFLMLLGVAASCALIAWISRIPIRSAVAYLFGLDADLKKPGKDSEKGISEGLWALGFILTQAATLAASQLGQTSLSEAPWGYCGRLAILYVPATIIVIGSVVGMIRSTKRTDADTVRTFDSGSLFFMRCVLFWGLVFAAGLPACAWFGLLPTQITSGKTALNDWSAKASTIDAGDTKGDAGVEVTAPIGRTQFPNGVPAEVMVSVTVGQQLIAAGWGVRDGEIFVGDPAAKIPHKTKIHFTKYIQDEDAAPEPAFGAQLKNLARSETYNLVLVLWKPKATKKDAEEMARKLSDQKEKALDLQSAWTTY